MKKKWKWSYLTIGIMVIAGSLMIGITDFLVAGASLSRIKEGSFWLNLGATNGGIICLIMAILVAKVDSFKEKDKRYIEVTGGIYDFTKDSMYSQPLFNKFLHTEYNIKSKKDAYLEKMQKQYDKLKPSAKDLEIYNGTDEDAKKKNKYCRKEKALSIQMSDEYIEKNLPKMNITYDTYTEALVFSGIRTTSKDKSYVTKNVAGKVTLDLIPKFLIGFMITSFTAVFTFGLKDGITTAVIINTASKIFTIISQSNFASNYANKFNEEVTLGDAMFRGGIIDHYKTWYMIQTQKKGVDVDV